MTTDGMSPLKIREGGQRQRGRVYTVDRISLHRALVGASLTIVVAAALTPRLAGYDSYPLWLDEAWRANLMLDPHWYARLLDGSTFSSITSFTYAWLNHT